MSRRSLSIALCLCLMLGQAASTTAAAPDGSDPSPSPGGYAGAGARSVLTTAEEERAEPRFTDVPETAPCYAAVDFCVRQGVLQGLEPDRFDPEGLVTRAALVTTLQRMSGEEAPEVVGYCPDVSGSDWFAPAAAWAMASGIVTGRSDGSFAPQDPVTRAELAAVLYRCAAHLGWPTRCSGLLGGYPDAGQVADYAVEPLSWALGNGIFGCLAVGEICPDLPVARGQLAQVLTAFLSHGTGDAQARQIVLDGMAALPESASKACHGEIQAAVEQAAAKYGAIGVQVAVVEDGRVSDTFATGWADRSQYAIVDQDGNLCSWEGGVPMTAQHRMRAASLSKVAVALAVMSLREEGALDLDEPIGTYWGCDIHNPYYPDAPVTARDLLAHTSSIFLAGDSVSRKRGSVQTRLSGGSGFSRLVPGDWGSWGYNNYGFAVLGMTAELAGGEVLDEVLDRRFFHCLGIDAAFEAGSIQRTDLLCTLYDGERVSRSIAAQKKLKLDPTPGATGQYFAGGLTISANDLGKLTALLASGGSYSGVRLLSAESVALMETRSPLPVAEGAFQCLPLRYQDGLYGREGIYYHTGSAYGSYHCLSYDPETGDGVVVLTTGASGVKDGQGIYAICSEIAAHVYSALRG